MVNYKTVKQFSAESGYTEAAIRAKISDGTWTENLVWRHAPDNRVLIDVRGYENWVEGKKAPKRAILFPKGGSGTSRIELVSGSPPPLV
jgi:hypothetical protein